MFECERLEIIFLGHPVNEKNFFLLGTSCILVSVKFNITQIRKIGDENVKNVLFFAFAIYRVDKKKVVIAYFDLTILILMMIS